MSETGDTLSLGKAFLSAGRYPDALGVARNLVEQSPEKPDVLLFAVSCALPCDEAAWAVEILRPAMARHPNDLALLNALVDSLAALDRHEDSIPILERMLTLRPPGAIADHMRLGRIRHFLGQYDAAISCFLKVLSIDPDHGEAFDALSAVCNSAGRTEMAREWRESKPRPPALEALGAFVYSEATSDLSDQEYERALRCLDAVDAMITSRNALPSGHFGLPSGQWDLKDSMYGKVLHPRDRDIIRKLRFHTQEFTGIRLPFLDPARGAPRIDCKLPDDMDTVLRLTVPNPETVYPHIRFLQTLPDEVVIPSPRRFAELGWEYRGGIYNIETLYVIVHVADLHHHGLLDMLRARSDGRPRVALEVGGGYGALAYRLAQLVPDLRYVIVDLPESLAFSSIYLSTLFPDAATEFVDVGEQCRQLDRPGFSFVSNAAFRPGVLGEGRINLAINTMSLGEMSDLQVETYGNGIAALLDEGGAFFEANHSCLDGFDYVGRRIAPAFAACGNVVKRSFFFPGRGHIWSSPHPEACARFARLTGEGGA